MATTTTTRTVQRPDSTNPLSLTTLTETATMNGRRYTRVYDAASKTFTSTTPAGRQSTATLDALGRVTHAQATGLLPIDLQYDARGRPVRMTQGTGVDARTVTMTYKDTGDTSNGYLDTIIDPLGRAVSFAYDQAGRLTGQTLPDGRVIQTTYDANGNVVSLTPPGRPVHAFDYTPIDALQQETPPNVPDGGTHQTVYTYNADRQLTQVTRPDGQTVTLDYDTAGRLHTQTLARGQTTYALYPRHRPSPDDHRTRWWDTGLHV